MPEGCPVCEARLANGRKRTAKWRAKGKGDATVTSPLLACDVTPPAYKGEAVSDVTPPPPARHSVPPKKTLPPPPKGGSPSVRAAPKPNKSGETIDLLRAAGVPENALAALTPKDHAAVKQSRLSPGQIAEAYAAAFKGEWGGDWLQENLNMGNVLGRYAGYLAWKQRAPTPPRTNGTTNGVYHQPQSQQPNRRPDYVPAFTHELARIDPAVAQRELAERKRLTLPEKLAAARNGTSPGGRHG